MNKTRRDFLKIAGMTSLAISTFNFSNCSQKNNSKPNIVIIFADDMGYGDAGVFGHPTIRTPFLDRMAREGMKLTQFYVASSVCSPSRAALLTGRLPKRTGTTGVYWPVTKDGLAEEEILLSNVLKDAGYATSCIGKWHLGHAPGYLPTDRGFDSYFGVPYSNDMYIGPGDNIASDAVFNEGYDLAKTKQDQQTIKESIEKSVQFWEMPSNTKNKVPLFEKDEIVEYPADQSTLTKRYTKRAIDFIKTNKEIPFFLYLAHSFPHVPLYASETFEKSRRGLYGDVIEELDWSVGQVLNTLKHENIHENTLVIFTSDNGPWLSYQTKGGSAGLLRGGKSSTWEGGMRVPCIVHWPGTVPGGTVNMELTSTLDLLPTIQDIIGAQSSEDRVLDGFSIKNVLARNGKSPRDVMFYYAGGKLRAVRMGVWKLHYDILPEGKEFDNFIKLGKPLLYHLEHDPGEQYDIADKHPEIIAQIEKIAKKHLNDI